MIMHIFEQLKSDVTMDTNDKTWAQFAYQIPAVSWYLRNVEK